MKISRFAFSFDFRMNNTMPMILGNKNINTAVKTWLAEKKLAKDNVHNINKFWV